MQRVWLFIPQYVVQQNLPSPLGSWPQLETQCALLFKLRMATPSGRYGLAFGLLVLWAMLIWHASHQPQVCLGSHWVAGIQCHAALFSVITRMLNWWSMQHKWILSFFVGWPLWPPSWYHFASCTSSINQSAQGALLLKGSLILIIPTKLDMLPKIVTSFKISLSCSRKSKNTDRICKILVGNCSWVGGFLQFQYG